MRGNGLIISLNTCDRLVSGRRMHERVPKIWNRRFCIFQRKWYAFWLFLVHAHSRARKREREKERVLLCNSMNKKKHDEHGMKFHFFSFGRYLPTVFQNWWMLVELQRYICENLLSLEPSKSFIDFSRRHV